jgi:hypothetical protein
MSEATTGDVGSSGAGTPAAVTRPPAGLPAELEAVLEPAARQWLDEARGKVATDPSALGTLFPAVGRKVGRSPLDRADEQGLLAGTVDDVARGVLLQAAQWPTDELAREVELLYRHGDAAERRGVLRNLHLLSVGERGLPLVNDALRTNDVRLVAAALGPYATEHLDDEAFRQAVLKCAFVGVPFAAVDGLAERADDRLARMLVSFAHERVAAGREVPADVWTVVDRFPDELTSSPIVGELESPVPERRAAAERALADRPALASRSEQK